MVAYATTRRRRLAAKAAETKVLRRRAPPSATLINWVLEYADLRDDMGGSRVMLRLSPMRLAEAALRRALGDEAERAGDVAVIWDEREDEIFRVLDGGAPRWRWWPTSRTSTSTWWGNTRAWRSIRTRTSRGSN